MLFERLKKEYCNLLFFDNGETGVLRNKRNTEPVGWRSLSPHPWIYRIAGNVLHRCSSKHFLNGIGQSWRLAFYME